MPVDDGVTADEVHEAMSDLAPILLARVFTRLSEVFGDHTPELRERCFDTAMEIVEIVGRMALDGVEKEKR